MYADEPISQTYRVMRGYKEPRTRATFEPIVQSLLAVGLRGHFECATKLSGTTDIGWAVVPAAIHGSQSWRPGNWHPVSVVWGAPMRFDGLPKNAKGYREASAELEREIHRLWRWLVELHEAGRPAAARRP